MDGSAIQQMIEGKAASGLGLALQAALAAVAALIILRMAVPIFLGGRGRVRPETFGGVEMAMAAGLIALFSILMAGGQHSNAGASREFGLETLFAGGIFQIGLCATVLAALLMRRHPLIKIGGYNAMSFGRQMAWSIFFLAISLPLIEILSRLSIRFHGGEPTPQAIVDFARSVEAPDSQLAIILFAVVVAPITEEFLFRGFLYPALKSTLGGLLALVLTSALFGMIHMNAQAALPLGGLGLVMALAYERTGSLIVPMTVHALFNAISLVAMRLPIAPPAF